MLEFFASVELRSHPTRLLSTAGPYLSWISGILIFRKNLRIGTARPIGTDRTARVFKPAQTFFELGLFLRYPANQRVHSSSIEADFNNWLSIEVHLLAVSRRDVVIQRSQTTGSRIHDLDWFR
jgi:hypothetical protein